MVDYRSYGCETLEEYVDVLEYALVLAGYELDLTADDDEKDAWGCSHPFDWVYELKSNSVHHFERRKKNG